MVKITRKQSSSNSSQILSVLTVFRNHSTAKLEESNKVNNSGGVAKQFHAFVITSTPEPEGALSNYIFADKLTIYFYSDIEPQFLYFWGGIQGLIGFDSHLMFF